MATVDVIPVFLDVSHRSSLTSATRCARLGLTPVPFRGTRMRCIPRGNACGLPRHWSVTIGVSVGGYALAARGSVALQATAVSLTLHDARSLT